MQKDKAKLTAFDSIEETNFIQRSQSARETACAHVDNIHLRLGCCERVDDLHLI